MMRAAMAGLLLLGAGTASAQTFSIGGTTSSWTQSTYFRGNVYLAELDTTLSSFAVYMGFGSTCDVELYVHSGSSARGPWTVEWYRSLTASANTGFLDSGAIGLLIQNGRYYGMGMGWTCNATYYGANPIGQTSTPLGTFQHSYWDNGYVMGSPTYAPGSVGAGTIAYYHEVSLVPPNTDADGDGFTLNDGDCDDNDPTAFPGGVEVCDGADNNCDGQVDEGLTTTAFPDLDGDGYGAANQPTPVCVLGAPYVLDDSDCDDSDPDVSPDAVEVCDEIDNDCDGQIDEGVTITFWLDEDGDGFGDASASIEGCSPPPGYSENPLDCDDGDALVYPGSLEVCNGIDDDCDEMMLEGEFDLDEDGWFECEGDCDDGEASVHPAADEVCNGRDDDCDGELLTEESDQDGDGISACKGDCNDLDATVNPGFSAELCFDGLDNDCNGTVDDGCPAEPPKGGCGCSEAGGAAGAGGLGGFLALALMLGVRMRRP
jgi:hypothetical protein